MNLKDYFERHHGLGVLSTADGDGRVDAAVYSRPHVFPDGTLAFVMRERLTHQNLQTNPHASFLFVESGEGYRGIRVFLKKIREETDSPLISEMTRMYLTPEEDRRKGPKFLVHFSVEKILPLIGSADPGVSIT